MKHLYRGVLVDDHEPFWRLRLQLLHMGHTPAEVDYAVCNLDRLMRRAALGKAGLLDDPGGFCARRLDELESEEEPEEG